MTFASAAAAFYLIACFALAALAKLRDFPRFAATVADIAPVLPARAAAGAAIAVEGVIALTIGGGMMCDSHIWIVAGAVLAIGGAAVFAGAIGFVLRRGDVVMCRCFGDDDQAITPASLLGPGLIAAAALIVVRGESSPESPAVWIAGVAAGAYLLIGHRLVSRMTSRPQVSA